MDTVTNMDELNKNFETLNSYLSAKTDPEYTFALNLIHRGTCFIAVKVDGEYKFYRKAA